MIYKVGGHTRIKCGTGDVGVVAGVRRDINGKYVGVLGFENQEPKPIGNPMICNENKNISDFEIAITFSKIESVDAIIAQLQKVREKLLIAKELER